VVFIGTSCPYRMTHTIHTPGACRPRGRASAPGPTQVDFPVNGPPRTPTTSAVSKPRQVVAGRVYLVTRRCTQRQFLLRPDRETNNAFLYCLGYAAERAGIQLVAFIANSNHYHAVLRDVEGRLPEFLQSFHKLLAKHQNCLRGRWENMWSSEHSSVVELVGPDDVLAKVVYTLTNPVKDHLVERAHYWPGASSLHATTHGQILVASRPSRFFRVDGTMPKSVEVRCAQAPGFEHLSRDEYRRVLLDAIAQSERAAHQERQTTGRRLLGRKTVLAQRPYDRPDSPEPRRQLNPRIAARDKWPRIEAISRMRVLAPLQN
jgi:putative transposase